MVSSINDNIGKPEDSQRTFIQATKRQLYNQDPTCKICNQQIMIIKDSQVDYIIPNSKGGKLITMNVRQLDVGLDQKNTAYNQGSIRPKYYF